MADLEEGEIADSDSETTAAVDTTKHVYQFGQSTGAIPKHHESFRFSTHRHSPTPRDSYRSGGAPTNDNSSDESVDTSDEDSPLWNCKRTKYLNKLKMEGVDPARRSQSPQFINPLRDKHRSSPVLKPPPRKKGNNIWGSVLQEQSLTQTMGVFGVDKDEDVDLDAQDRNVESYNYKKAREDKRPFRSAVAEDEMEGSDSDPFGGVVDLEPDEEKEKERKKRKRKRNAKERLGQRSDLDRLGDKMYKDYIQKSKGSAKSRLGSNSGKYRFGDIPDVNGVKAVTVTEEDSVPDVIDAIVDALSEPKDDLITRVVKRLGQKKSIQLLHMTEDVENSGGMMIKDGSRRRSPGGVYLQLLKSDSEVTKADVDFIFADHDKHFFEEMKRRKAAKKARKRKELQRKREELKRQMAAMNGETSHDHHSNGNSETSMHMDHDASNGAAHAASSDSDASEGEITPGSSDDQDKKEDRSADLVKDESVTSLGEEDMLTITVGEEDSIE